MDYQNYQSTQDESKDLFNAEPNVYASFGERFGALIIDYILLIFLVVMVMLILGPENPLVNILTLFAGWLYYAIQESSSAQATIGKRALRIKVVDMNGERISFGKASGRYFGKIVSGMILCIGYLMMLWDDNKQTLHDKMASTLMIKARS